MICRGFPFYVGYFSRELTTGDSISVYFDVLCWFFSRALTTPNTSSSITSWFYVGSFSRELPTRQHDDRQASMFYVGSFSRELPTLYGHHPYFIWEMHCFVETKKGAGSTRTRSLLSFSTRNLKTILSLHSP